MKLILIASIMLLVFQIGTKTLAGDLLTCVRRPASLLKIILAMFVAAPLLAVVLVKIFDAPTVMKGAVLEMAISAVAPMLPRKLFKLGVDTAFAESLSLVTTVLAIPLVPLSVAVLAILFSRDLEMSATAVMGTLATTFLIPLALGMVSRLVLREKAARLGDWLATIATVVLVALVLVSLIRLRAAVFSLLWEALPLVLLFAAGSLLIGHLFGGPNPRERTALAIATVTRHPGLAMLIATTNAPQAAALPAILAVILGTTVVGIPYTAWRKHDLAAHPPALSARANVR